MKRLAPQQGVMGQVQGWGEPWDVHVVLFKILSGLHAAEVTDIFISIVSFNQQVKYLLPLAHSCQHEWCVATPGLKIRVLSITTSKELDNISMAVLSSPVKSSVPGSWVSTVDQL